MPKSSLNFGFPYFPPPPFPTPKAAYMPEITSPLTPLSPTLQLPSKPKSTFLTIPLELRLQIYSYVLISHPIHHAHLAPLEPPTSFSGMNTEEFHTTRLAPSHSPGIRETEVRTLITHLAASSEEQKINALYPISKPTSIVAAGQQKVQGKLPTALLTSCKQVFEEAHMVPWEQNTFTFINWFWSGVYASRQFTRSLRPWQSDAMRYVGVEVVGRDLRVDGMAKLGGGIGVTDKERGEWWELCGLWKGVWGLRLGVKGAVGGEKKEVDEPGGWNGELGQVEEVGNEERKERGILDVNAEWVQHGLLLMKELRWVEIEIDDEDAEREEKIRFCGELEGAFNTQPHLSSMQEGEQGPEKGKVKVIFIERLKVAEEPVSNKDFTWYGGTAGDDSIFGLDTGM
jgi:hypothetical protein